MAEPAVKRTWSFGSFVCVRSFPRLFVENRVAGDGATPIGEPVVVAINSPPTAEAEQQWPAATTAAHRRSA
jgi:hypothetical protein